MMAYPRVDFRSFRHRNRLRLLLSTFLALAAILVLLAVVVLFVLVRLAILH